MLWVESKHGSGSVLVDFLLLLLLLLLLLYVYVLRITLFGCRGEKACVFSFKQTISGYCPAHLIVYK